MPDPGPERESSPGPAPGPPVEPRSSGKPRKRRRKRLGQNSPAGSRPGTLTVPEGSPPPRIRVIRFTSDALEEREFASDQGLKAFVDRGGIAWVDVQGLGDQKVIEGLGRCFGLHQLLLEDVVNVPQRPKTELYGDRLFTVSRRLAWSEGRLEQRQVSLVMGPNFVLSFQERPDDALDALRTRLGQPDSLSRRSGADYLLYALLDVLVDGYFPVVARIGEGLEALEEKALDSPGQEFLRELQPLRSDLLSVRHDVWPQREALHALQRGDAGPIGEPVRVYLRDCHDHCVQVAEVVDVQRELASGLLNLYMTSVANRTNEVMKVLTIMSTIFIPLTFLAGVYGMNLVMPEARWSGTYPVVLVVMAATVLAMIVYFRRRGWIGSGSR